MAKRRKSRKMTTYSRRRSGRRMSGIGAVSLNEVGAALAGAVASRFIVNQLGAKFPNLVSSPINKAVGQIVLGVVTKPIAGAFKIKSPMVDALGKGMMIGGGYELIRSVAPKTLGQTGDEGDVIVVSGADEISKSMAWMKSVAWMKSATWMKYPKSMDMMMMKFIN